MRVECLLWMTTPHYWSLPDASPAEEVRGQTGGCCGRLPWRQSPGMAGWGTAPVLMKPVLLAVLGILEHLQRKKEKADDKHTMI